MHPNANTLIMNDFRTLQILECLRIKIHLFSWNFYSKLNFIIMIFFDSQSPINNTKLTVKSVCIFAFRSSVFLRLGVKCEWPTYFCVLGPGRLLLSCKIFLDTQGHVQLEMNLNAFTHQETTEH